MAAFLQFALVVLESVANNVAMSAICITRPGLHLRGHVRFYAQRKVQLNNTVVVHPVTARAMPVLEFVFADTIRLHYNGQRFEEISPRAVLVGIQTHNRLQLRLRGSIECFAIMFNLAGCTGCFPFPLRN
jgi:hypothetical protein